jgi:hypothetical protein
MRLRGSAELLEDRRRRALGLLDEGRSLNAVARQIGCSASSVMRWREMRSAGGTKGLRVRSSPGRPPKIGAASCTVLLRILLAGAFASGYPMLALAKKRGFLTGEGLEPSVEVLDVCGVERLLQDLLDDGEEVVEGSDGGQWRS